MQADCRDAFIPRESFKHLCHVNVGLVANGVNAGQWQPTPRECEVAGNVAGLRDDGHTTVCCVNAMFVRPKGRA